VEGKKMGMVETRWESTVNRKEESEGETRVVR